MINQFQKHGYERLLIEQQIHKVNLQEREHLLKEKKKNTGLTIHLSFKYNRALPEIIGIVLKHWHLLHIKPNLTEIFRNASILAFRRNKTSESLLIPN